MTMTEAEVLERLRAAVPANVREVCAQLARNGREAVTVGGAVRDAILGRSPGDWDVATSAHPEAVLALFRHCIPTGLQHGTVTIVTGKGEESHVEVTTFRGEGEYTDARRPDRVEFGVPHERDLARRDLRVNAMAYDPAAGVLIDPFGGRRDLEDRVLRAVGPTGDVFVDAVARFTEDGLRVMRAVRFAAQLEFALDPETARGIAEAGPRASLAKVSRERVSDELRKILDTREPSRALGPARATGILKTIAPALDAAIADEAAWIGAIDRAPVRARLAVMFAPLAGIAERELDAMLRALKLTVDEVRAVVAIVTRFERARAAATPADVRAVLAAVGGLVRGCRGRGLGRLMDLGRAPRGGGVAGSDRRRRARDRRQGSDGRRHPGGPADPASSCGVCSGA